MAAFAQIAQSDVSPIYGPIAPYRGFASNRGVVHDSVSGAGSAYELMTRYGAYARDQLVDPSPVFAIGWYVNTSGVEVVQAGSYQITASIEYPIGTFTQCKFGGNATGVFTGGDTAIADAASVSIPRGAFFAIKWWLKTPNGWTYHNNYAALPGDSFNLSSAGGTTADLTMSAMAGSAAPGAVGVSILGVIATTTQRSFLCIGDSLSAGDDKDSRDASADFGLLSRIVGPTRGYGNVGRSSTLASQFIAGNADRRIALAANASDILCMLGINDILGGASATTTRDRVLAVRNLFSTKRFYPSTLLGDTRAGFVGTAVDASDQTVNATNSPIIDAYNVLARAGFAATTGPQISGILDFNAIAMFAPNRQKFLPGWSGDGLHLTGPAWRLAAAAVPGRDLLLS